MKSSPIRVVGKTTDDRLVVDGIWTCFETHGLPFDILFDICLQRGWVPDWSRLLRQMVDSGMAQDRAISKLREAISDTFGPCFCHEVLARLSK